ncbi:MAG: hypothetical protein AB1505_36400 [Candidatus Latescibacterota bacterium]
MTYLTYQEVTGTTSLDKSAYGWVFFLFVGLAFFVVVSNVVRVWQERRPAGAMRATDITGLGALQQSLNDLNKALTDLNRGLTDLANQAAATSRRVDFGGMQQEAQGVHQELSAIRRGCEDIRDRVGQMKKAWE